MYQKSDFYLVRQTICTNIFGTALNLYKKKQYMRLYVLKPKNVRVQFRVPCFLGTSGLVYQKERNFLVRGTICTNKHSTSWSGLLAYQGLSRVPYFWYTLWYICLRVPIKTLFFRYMYQVFGTGDIRWALTQSFPKWRCAGRWKLSTAIFPSVPTDRTCLRIA